MVEMKMIVKGIISVITFLIMNTIYLTLSNSLNITNSAFVAEAVIAARWRIFNKSLSPYDIYISAFGE